MHKITGTIGVDAVECLVAQRLGSPRRMNDIVEALAAQCLLHLLTVREVKLNEVYAPVAQVCPTACAAHCRPYLHADSQCLLHQKGAYKA